jgi:homoaconitase/3-isopropylmalate dehydratase large subunit/3-isopropylmalate dehydratase small subunit
MREIIALTNTGPCRVVRGGINQSVLAENLTTDALTRIPDVLLLDETRIANSFLEGWSYRNGFNFQVDDGVLVTGPSLGIGSSRENSAEAVVLNGYQVVFAPSFGPIFAQNLVNQGVIPCSDFSLLERITEGQDLPSDVLMEELSEGDQRIIAYGGLPGYIRAIANGQEKMPQHFIERQVSSPQTAVEKLLSTRSSLFTSNPIPLFKGDSLILSADKFIGYDVFWAQTERILNKHYEGLITVPEKDLAIFSDHFGTSNDPNAQEAQKKLGLFWQQHPQSFRGDNGVYNQVMARMLPPGSIVLGMDSHSPELAVVPGVYVMPVGYTGFASALANEGLVQASVPGTVRLEIEGDLPPHIDIKDVIWQVIGQHFSGDLGNGKVIELGGAGFSRLSFQDAAKLCNAATEMGATGVIVTEFNRQIYEHLREHNPNFKDVSVDEVKELILSLKADKDASYDAEISFDMNQTQPVLVGPKTHKRVRTLDNSPKVSFNRVIYSSCGGANLLDIAILAEILSDHDGNRVLPVDIHFADPLVRFMAEKIGLFDQLIESGATIDGTNSCGPCMGLGAAVRANEVVASTNNRNYPGRMGDPTGEVYLASPIVVALIAKLGREPTIDEVCDVSELVQKARKKVGQIRI